MKIAKVAGLAALVVLALGQARADEGPAPGLGFGIVRGLEAAAIEEQATETTAWDATIVAPSAEYGPQGFLKITSVERTAGPLPLDEQ